MNPETIKMLVYELESTDPDFREKVTKAVAEIEQSLTAQEIQSDYKSQDENTLMRLRIYTKKC